MTKRMTIMLVCLAILFGALIGWRLFVNDMLKKIFSQPMPPVVVSTMKVQTRSWQPYLMSTASLMAQQNVNIMPQVAGIVTKIYFQSGDVVEKGAPLVDLDDSVEQANLASDEARVKLSEAVYDRAKKLSPGGIISKAEYDTAVATLAQDNAAVERDKVLIAQKHITAPFSGKLGIRQINLGEYVALGGTTPIVNLQTLDPLDVEFNLTQIETGQIHVGQPILFSADAFPGREFQGTVTATNAGFSPETRMLTIRASIPNPQHELYPGMYGEIKVLLPNKTSVIAVPQTAIEYNLYGNSIYVVKHEGEQTIAKQVFVNLGQRREDVIVVEKGLNAGDEIVTVGQIKLFDGAPVVIRNDQVPKQGQEPKLES